MQVVHPDVFDGPTSLENVGRHGHTTRTT